MKLGEYVRNEYGIAKLIDIDIQNGYEFYVFNNEICYLVDSVTKKKTGKLLNAVRKDLIDEKKLNHSKNIIKLLKPGDYVNGYKIQDITYCGTRLVVFTDDMRDFTEKDINTIVTKEDFEKVEYIL